MLLASFFFNLQDRKSFPVVARLMVRLRVTVLSQHAVLVSFEAHAEAAACAAAHIVGVLENVRLLYNVVLARYGTVIKLITLVALDQSVHLIHNFLLEIAGGLSTPCHHLILNQI